MGFMLCGTALFRTAMLMQNEMAKLMGRVESASLG
jgi:hypothetical protein